MSSTPSSLFRYSSLSLLLTLSLAFLSGCGSSTNISGGGNGSPGGNTPSPSPSTAASSVLFPVDDTVSAPFQNFLTQSDSALSNCMAIAREALFAPAIEGLPAGASTREIVNNCEARHEEFLAALSSQASNQNLSAEDLRRANHVQWMYEAELNHIFEESRDMGQPIDLEPHRVMFSGGTNNPTAESVLFAANRADQDVTSCMNTARRILPAQAMEPSPERILLNVRLAGLVSRCDEMVDSFVSGTESYTRQENADPSVIERRTQVGTHYEALLTALFEDARDLHLDVGIEPVSGPITTQQPEVSPAETVAPAPEAIPAPAPEATPTETPAPAPEATPAPAAPAPGAVVPAPAEQPAVAPAPAAETPAPAPSESEDSNVKPEPTSPSSESTESTSGSSSSSTESAVPSNPYGESDGE